MSRHITILLFTLISSFSIRAQVLFSYIDNHGNQFNISNSNKIIPRFDSTFLKSNLTGDRLQFGTEADTIRFIVWIGEIKKLNRYNFKIRLQKYPLTSDLLEMLKNMGYLHYIMKVSYRKGKPYVNKIEFLEAEI
jgi:hypothetical protein